jgi:hypothetical protein
MKPIMTLGAIIGALLLSSSPALLAQNGPGAGKGKGYGGPPATQEERAARQAECKDKNGGVCPNGGPRSECQGIGQGKGAGKGAGMGAGKGQQRGPRDGSGPRGGNGTCTGQNAPLARR